MSPIHTWVCLLLWIGSATQDKPPDTHVTCIFSEQCVLPCAFQPGGDEQQVHWYRQDVLVFRFQSGNSGEEEEEDEEKESEEKRDEEEDQEAHEQQLLGRASLSPLLVASGNATLTLRDCGPRDRGRYRCHVRTSAGVQEAHVIVKVEAPIQSVKLELSRLSGYEEVKCTIRQVYPAPHVTWATEPPSSHMLRPITRKLADRQGLYTIESRLRRVKSHPELTYICKVSSSYGTQGWTASLREREISGREGRDISIPCHAPSYLSGHALSWIFTNGRDYTHILTYDSQSQDVATSPSWEEHTELEPFRVAFGDGSLRLMDPDRSEHTGIYTCEFSAPYKTHTEETEVTILAAVAGEPLHSLEPSYWWVVALVVAVLVLALVGILAYLMAKGRYSRTRKRPEETTELGLVKDATGESCPSEDNPLTVEDTNGKTIST